MDFKPTSQPNEKEINSGPGQAHVPTPDTLGSDTSHGHEVGNLLGDISFDRAYLTESKMTDNSAGGDTQVKTGHGFDYSKEFPLSSARIDQVSPPPGSFVELDKGGLLDDQPSAPTAPPTLDKDEFNLFQSESYSYQSELEKTLQEQKEGGYQVGASFSKEAASFQKLSDEEEAKRFSSPFEMISSLDDVQPPEFYESGDSSMSKEVGGGNKSATDSQILEPDDLEEYLPKDPVTNEVPSTTSTLPATPADVDLKSHIASTNILVEEAMAEFTSDSGMKRGDLFEFEPSSTEEHYKTESSNEATLLEDFAIPHDVAFLETVTVGLGFQTESKDSDFNMFQDQVDDADEEEKSSPYNFYIKEPLFVPEESIPFDSQTASPTTVGLDFDQFEYAVEPNVEKMEVEHVRKLEAQHAELSSFLQERDPTLNLDEYDRSEDSISPNPQIQPKSFPAETKSQAHYGFDYDPDFEPVPQEPIMAAVKIEATESRAFPKPTPFEHVELPENESPESVDDYEFEVIPPKVPPHRYPLEEVKQLEPEVPQQTAAQDLYQVGEPIGMSKSPPPPVSSEVEKQTEADARKQAEEEELFPFLPKESFETIPPVYKAPEISPKDTDLPQQLDTTDAKAKPAASPKVARNVSGVNASNSEEAQKILNIFNPKAWFDPNKLHPNVSELVYWRDPKKSGVVFGSILLVLIALTCLSFISVVAYTALAVLSGTFAFRVYKNVVGTIQKTDEGHPFKEYLEQDLSLESDKTQEICKAIVTHANNFAIKLRHLFLVEDLVDSAKFGAALYFLTYLGSWFNGLTLVIIAFLALFGLPKVYEMNKRVIDQYMDLACAKVSEISAKVHEALPFGKKEKAQ